MASSIEVNRSSLPLFLLVAGLSCTVSKASCPEGYYGIGCLQRCRCHQSRSASCDELSGRCQCKPGYTGTACQEDINECFLEHPPCRGRNQYCYNTPGSYECHCRVGFRFSEASGVCYPCPRGKYGHNCKQSCSCQNDNTAICETSSGMCICYPGWEGATCGVSVDDCRGNPCPGQLCVDKHQGYLCLCETKQRVVQGECSDYQVDMISFNLNPGVGELVDIYILFALPQVYQVHASYGPNFVYKIQDNSSTAMCVFNFYLEHQKVLGDEPFLKRLQSTTKYNFYSHLKRRFLQPGHIMVKAEPIQEDYYGLVLMFDVDYKTLSGSACLHDMHIHGTGNTLQNAAFYYRQSYQEYKIVFPADLACRETPRVEWEFYALNDVLLEQNNMCDRGIFYERLDIEKLVLASGEPSISDHHEAKEIIPRNTLPVGFILVCVRAYVQKKKEFYAVSCGYVEILPSYTIRGLLRPFVRMLTWSPERRLVVTADFHEPDQDLPLTFMWSCKSNRGLCPHIHGSTERQLRLPRYFMVPGQDYRLSVTVALADSPYVTISANITVRCLSASSMLYAMIKCTLSCEHTIGTGKNVALYMGTGQKYSRRFIRYKWEVQENGLPLPYAQVLGIVRNENLESPFFITRSNVLTPGCRYDVTCTVKVGRRSSIVTYTFHTEAPPLGSGCTIQPRKGKAVFTKFNISCPNYMDTVAYMPLSYRLYQQDKVVDGTRFFYTLIAYTSSAWITGVTLSVENVTHAVQIPLKVEIVNIKGTASVVYLVVELTTDDQTAILDKLGSLADLGNSGNQEDVRAVKDIATIINAKSTASAQRKTQVRQELLSNLQLMDSETPSSVQHTSFVLDTTVAQEEEIQTSGLDHGLSSAETLTKYLGKVSPDNFELTKHVADIQVHAVGRLLSVTSDVGKSIARDQQKAKSMGFTQQQNKEHSFKAINSISQVAETLTTSLTEANVPIWLSTKNVELGVEWQNVSRNAKFELASTDGNIRFYLPTSDMGILENEGVESEFKAYHKDPYAWASRDMHGEMPVVSVDFVRQRDKYKKGRVPREWRFSRPADVFIRYKDSSAETVEYHPLIDVDVSEKTVLRSSCVFMSVKASTTEATILRVTSPNGLRLKVKIRYTGKISSFDHLSEEEMLEIPYPEDEYLRTPAGMLKRDKDLLFLPQLRELQVKHETHYYRVKLTVQTQQEVNLNALTLVTADGNRGLLRSSRADAGVELYNVSVQVTPYRVSCVHFSKEQERYLSKDCAVSKFSNLNTLHCRCLVAASYTGSVLVMPNLMSPLDIGLFLEVVENPLVVTIVLAIWISFVAGILWARRKDQWDEYRRGVTILEDNLDDHEYLYLVCVVTGLSSQASTSSNVFLFLKGTWAKSTCHILRDDTRRLFQSGDQNWFVLTTAQDLGELMSIVVWTDFSGSQPAWYLSSVYIENIQTEETWLCVFNNWISTQRGSRQLIVEVPAVKEQETSTHWSQHLVRKAKSDIRNEHLWIGMFAKSPFNMFSRVHRVVTGLSLLQSLMLFNMIFFHMSNADDSRQFLEVMGQRIHLTAIVVGLQTSILLVLVTYVVKTLLVSVEPRPHPAVKPQEKTEKDNRGQRAGLHIEEREVRLKRYMSKDYIHLTARNSSQGLNAETSGQLKSQDTAKSSSLVGSQDVRARTNGQEVRTETGDLTEDQKVTTETFDESGGLGVITETSGKVESLAVSTETDNKVKSPEIPAVDAGRSGLTTEKTQRNDASQNNQGKGPEQDQGQSRAGEGHDNEDKLMEAEKRPQEEFASMASEEEKESKMTDEEMERQLKKQQSFMFPWWCCYINWPFLAFYNIFLAYYVMLYGLHLGPEKSLEWLTAFFSGFFLNAMIVQPARVLVLVLVLVLVFKARHTLKDLAPLGQLNTTERLLRKRQMLKRYSTMSTAWVGDLRFRSPLTGAQAKAILARLKVETEAKAMLRDLFMYTVFMVAVVVMTYGHMDVYYRYMQTKYTRELLVGAQSYVDEEEHSQWLEKIHYVSDIWDYLVDTLVPQLLPDQPELAQSYNSYLVGPIRVRQVRVEPDHSEWFGRSESVTQSQ
ncbi:polycystic kidney disease protein 1-like 2 [Aplysia californica]|uniref:Polycystic kidney disease protein 1-like 2 n=1 Tax=Aplysia californica TaxID=6500 RepID=A0ABM0ZY83_APLCA|nr:polycystic kidney disease protein 1-like 2 [Aplysia californica]